MQETQERGSATLGWEDPLQWEMATHSSISAWKLKDRVEPGVSQAKESQRFRHYWVIKHVPRGLYH